MEMKEVRLKRLACAVSEARSKGAVKQWSPEIQREALSLAEKYGVTL